MKRKITKKRITKKRVTSKRTNQKRISQKSKIQKKILKLRGGYDNDSNKIIQDYIQATLKKYTKETPSGELLFELKALIGIEGKTELEQKQYETLFLQGSSDNFALQFMRSFCIRKSQSVASTPESSSFSKPFHYFSSKPYALYYKILDSHLEIDLSKIPKAGYNTYSLPLPILIRMTPREELTPALHAFRYLINSFIDEYIRTNLKFKLYDLIIHQSQRIFQMPVLTNINVKIRITQGKIELECEEYKECTLYSNSTGLAFDNEKQPIKVQLIEDIKMFGLQMKSRKDDVDVLSAHIICQYRDERTNIPIGAESVRTSYIFDIPILKFNDKIDYELSGKYGKIDYELSGKYGKFFLFVAAINKILLNKEKPVAQPCPIKHSKVKLEGEEEELVVGERVSAGGSNAIYTLPNKKDQLLKININKSEDQQELTQEVIESEKKGNQAMVKFLKKLTSKHPGYDSFMHIGYEGMCKCYGASKEQIPDSYCSLIENIKGNTLSHIVSPEIYKTKITFKNLKRLFWNIVFAIWVLHGDHGPGTYGHYDIKPDNIMFKNKFNDSKPNSVENYKIKIIDYGLLEENTNLPHKRPRMVTDPYYSPPEMNRVLYGEIKDSFINIDKRKRKKDDEGEGYVSPDFDQMDKDLEDLLEVTYDYRADIWMLGEIFFQLFLSLNPMGSLNTLKSLKSDTKDLKFPPEIRKDKDGQMLQNHWANQFEQGTFKFDRESLRTFYTQNLHNDHRYEAYTHDLKLFLEAFESKLRENEQVESKPDRLTIYDGEGGLNEFDVWPELYKVDTNFVPIKDLVLAIFKVKPEERMPLAQILRNEWLLDGIRDASLELKLAIVPLLEPTEIQPNVNLPTNASTSGGSRKKRTQKKRRKK